MFCVVCIVFARLHVGVMYGLRDFVCVVVFVCVCVSACVCTCAWAWP